MTLRYVTMASRKGWMRSNEMQHKVGESSAQRDSSSFVLDLGSRETEINSKGAADFGGEKERNGRGEEEGLGLRIGSRKRLKMLLLQQEAERAAAVYAEFVAEFENPTAQIKTFVRGSTINPDTKGERDGNFRKILKLNLI